MSDNVNDRCLACAKKIKRRPRAGKLRYPHKCPHGKPCSAGDPLWGTHYTRPRCELCRDEAQPWQIARWV